MFQFLKSVFNFRDAKKQLLYLIIASFFVAFAIAHWYSLSISHYVFIEGYHIHHFYFGTLLLSIGGILGILSINTKALRLASVMVGVGMGLFADEIGLLLNCTTVDKTCAYAFPDYFDIIGSIVIALIAVIILTDFVERYLRRQIKK